MQLVRQRSKLWLLWPRIHRLLKSGLISLTLALTGGGMVTPGAGGGGGSPAYTEIGSNQAAAGSAAFPISVSAVAQNKRILVAVGYQAGGGASITGVADSRGNVYAQDAISPFATVRCDVWSANATTALQAADVITVTFSNTTSVYVGVAAKGDAVTALDKSAAANSTSTTPDSGNTAATTVASELALGVVVANAATTLTSITAGYTASASSPVQGGVQLFVAWKILAATGVQHFGGTLGANVAWGADCCCYK